MFNLFKIFLTVLFVFSVPNVFSEQSIISPLAKKSLLLQSDRYESLAIVVGERGHILYSNNNDWQQASVETNQTLTNIFMHDEQTAWAVGHDAVVLKTNDGAKTWQKVFSDINEEAPLLDLFFKDDLNGIAVGAYSVMYFTEDGGLNWRKVELNLINKTSSGEDETLSEFTDVFDFHLNDIAYAGDNRFYIAAESGHILRSDDGGKSWLDLTSPYQGSFFGVLPLSYNNILAYGLRGHLYRSLDAGKSWEQIETASKEMLTDATVLSNGNIVVVGLGGTLLISKDNGKRFSNINLNHRNGLSAVLETEGGSLLLTGDAGIQIVPQNIFIVDH